MEFISENTKYQLQKNSVQKIKKDFLDILLNDQIRERNIYSNAIAINTDQVAVKLPQEHIIKNFTGQENTEFTIEGNHIKYINDSIYQIYCNNKEIGGYKYIEYSYGSYLCDSDTIQNYKQYYIRKNKDNIFEIFYTTYKNIIVAQKKQQIIEIVDHVASKRLIEKEFLRIYHNACAKALDYIEISEGFLKGVSEKNNKKNEIVNTNTKRLFLDRDAVIFRYIIQHIGSKYGIDPDQCSDLLLPAVLENKIRYNIQEIIGEKRDYSRLDKEASIAPIICEDISQEQLQIFKDILDNELGGYKNIFVIDGGVIGSTTKITQKLLQVVYAEKNIYTGLFFGMPETEKYIDFILSCHYTACHVCQHYEDRPKPFLHLQRFEQNKGIITEIRKNQITYDTIKNSDDPGMMKQLILDKAEPLTSKIFFIALGNMLSYYKQGKLNPTKKHKISKRSISHEKKYGL